nr:MAG TPA: hypothetical protein [Caudoviricetes sp.]
MSATSILSAVQSYQSVPFFFISICPTVMYIISHESAVSQNSFIGGLMYEHK